MQLPHEDGLVDNRPDGISICKVGANKMIPDLDARQVCGSRWQGHFWRQADLGRNMMEGLGLFLDDKIVRFSRRVVAGIREL